MALGGGVAGTVRNGPRIAPIGGGPCRGNYRTIACSTEPPDVGRQLFVNGAAVSRGEASGFAYQKCGPPLTNLAGFQSGEGMRHLCDQGLRQSQEPAASGR